MDHLEKSLKIQVRIGHCCFKAIAAPIQCSFTLAKDRVASAPSPWKIPIDSSIAFNTFLRIQVPDSYDNTKCNLLLYSRTNGSENIMGRVTLPLSPEKCGKARKYPVKHDGETIATIDASIYLFNFNHSLPLIQTNDSYEAQSQFYSLNLHRQNIIHYDSAFHQLKSSNEPTKIQQKKSSLSFGINSQMNLTIKQPVQKEVNTDFLFVKLFEEIDKKKNQINKRQAELNEKDAEIQHIKMKEMVFQQDSKKIQKLKQETSLLISTNNDLIHKDARYDEDYYRMKEEKETMQEQMAKFNSEASLKLMCLQTQLQSAKKKLDNREKKVNQLINQIQDYSKELNSLKVENKQKLKIIRSLYFELKQEDHQNKIENENTYQDVLQLLAIHFESKTVEPSNPPVFFQYEVHKGQKQTNIQTSRKCKALSLFKPNTLGSRSSTKQKFRQSKLPNESNQIPIPNIIEYIINLGSSKR